LDHPDLGPSICFADNGPGLANPVSLFTLGRSAWDASVVVSEDAAGFGFFSLANRGAQIIAQKLGTDCSWLLEASPAAFSGDEPVLGHEGPSHQKGLSITFPKRDRENVAAAVQHAARYCPLEIFLDGETMERSDFLADAKHVDEWNGIRIGVFHEPSRIKSFTGHNVNFHGVTLWMPLPDLHQQFHHSFHTRIDVTHCAALKLVLPARKEIMQDDFLEQLRMHIRKLFFELLLIDGRHSLSRKDYALGHALGVKLPEATMMLRPFVADVADTDRRDYSRPEPVTHQAILYSDAEGPVEEQNVARAISNLSDRLPLYEPLAAFNGYKWYDALSCIALKGYRATSGQTVQEIAPDNRFSVTERPDKLEVLLERSDGKSIEDICLETDALVLSEEYGALDEADIHVTANASMTPADLVEFLEVTLFSPSDDSEAGSYDQQQQWFTDEAEDLALTLLESSAAAEVNLVTRVLRRELTWRLPKDRDVTIRIKGRDVTVSGLNDAA